MTITCQVAATLLSSEDFTEVKDQELVKRTLEVVASGGYDVFILCTTTLLILNTLFNSLNPSHGMTSSIDNKPR